MSNIRIQDDLYQAVNGEWLENAVIPEDRSTAGGFSELDQEVERKLMADFKDFANGSKTSDIPEMKEAIKLYNKTLDVKRRNEEGIKPLIPLLNKILSIKTIQELNDNSYDLMLEGVDLPFNFGVETDMKDATINSFVITGPNIILPDTTYYDDNNPAKEKLLDIYKDMAKKL